MPERLLRASFIFLYFSLSLLGSLVLFKYIYLTWGAADTLLSLLIFPATFVVVPLYAGFVDGYWLPAITCYAPLALITITVVAITFFEITHDKDELAASHQEVELTAIDHENEQAA